MNITIVGGGNIGTQFAVHCAERGNKVIIYTTRPNEFSEILYIVDEKDRIIHSGRICLATDDANMAFKDADLIFVTVPAYLMSNMASKILSYAKPGMKVGLVPGTGGGECAFKQCVEKGCVVFGLQRVPSVARLIEYGKRVRCVGYREELFVGAIPNKFGNECAAIISNLFSKKCTVLPNYLTLTLTPSNPILHTTRLRTLFQDYRKGKYYDKIPLFYEGWNDESSALLFACDDEVQALCNRLTDFDLTYVKSLKFHYESYTIQALTKKIRSIKGFKGLETPCIKDENGYLPDFSSRYFTADFPFGLSIIKQIMDFVDMDAPNCKETLEWYYRVTDINTDEFRYLDYGIDNYDRFVEFYSK